MNKSPFFQKFRLSLLAKYLYESEHPISKEIFLRNGRVLKILCAKILKKSLNNTF